MERSFSTCREVRGDEQSEPNCAMHMQPQAGKAATMVFSSCLSSNPPVQSPSLGYLCVLTCTGVLPQPDFPCFTRVHTSLACLGPAQPAVMSAG